jgi:hypothetical protein
MLQAYDQAGTGYVQKTVEIRDDLVASGRQPSTRAIQRRLGKRVREMLPAEKITAITHCLDRIDLGEEFLPMPEQRREKSADLIDRFEKLDSKFKRSERKRNSATRGGCGTFAGSPWQRSDPTPTRACR